METDRKALAEKLRDVRGRLDNLRCNVASTWVAEEVAEIVDGIDGFLDRAALREEGGPDGWFSRVIGPDGPGMWHRYDGSKKPRIYIPDSTSWSVEHFPFRRHPHTEDESE